MGCGGSVFHPPYPSLNRTSLIANYPSLRRQYSLSVCLSVSKIDAASITKISTEMFHHASWKPIYLGVKFVSHKNIAGVGLCTLVSAGFF